MNIRAKIGKKGWDFCVSSGQLCVENPEGYSYESNLTKAEALIYQIGRDEGNYLGAEKIKTEIKDALGIL